MWVLVAEDKPRMARFIQRSLQSEGYTVELAFDGEQALSMGLSGGMDLMVLDCMLPRRDGFDVQFAHPRAPEIPRHGVAARARELIDDHHLRTEDRALRLQEVRSVARRGHAHQLALQILDDVGGQRAAVIEALVDNRR